MGTASIHEGVRRMRFSDLLDRTEAKKLTQEAASELLGINVRTIQRWAERFEAEGVVRKAPKRSAHRKKRPRRPLRGMLLHQDGSRHVWIEGLPAMDLIVTMDDATSEIYSMLLVEEEGTASTFQSLGEVIGEHGLFCALYTDRGSHYFYTPKAGEKVSRTQQTQVG